MRVSVKFENAANQEASLAIIQTANQAKAK
jgi:hypothetical protein